MIKALIFDLDGTLLDTVADIALAANTMLSRHGLPQYEINSFRSFIGNGLTNLVTQILPVEIVSSGKLANYVAEVAALYHEFADKHTRLFSGIADLLDQLVQRQLPLAILSNKNHEFMPAVIKKYLSAWSFTTYFGARPGIPLKPHPHSALEIANLLQLPAAEIAFIGDSEVDLQTAIAAAMQPIAVSWGFRSPAQLTAAGASLIINEPRELLHYLPL